MRNEGWHVLRRKNPETELGGGAGLLAGTLGAVSSALRRSPNKSGSECRGAPMPNGSNKSLAEGGKVTPKVSFLLHKGNLATFRLYRPHNLVFVSLTLECKAQKFSKTLKAAPVTPRCATLCRTCSLEPAFSVSISLYAS